MNTGYKPCRPLKRPCKVSALKMPNIQGIVLIAIRGFRESERPEALQPSSRSKILQGLFSRLQALYPVFPRLLTGISVDFGN